MVLKFYHLDSDETMDESRQEAFSVYLAEMAFVAAPASSLPGVVMISGTGSTLSALKAFERKMEVAAHNTANIQSDHYKSLSSTISEGTSGGIEVNLIGTTAPGPVVFEQVDGNMVEREISNVELGKEITDSVLVSRNYDANLKVLATRDEMLGSLLDIIG